LVIGSSNAERRTQRKIPGDCLSKTQVSANPQGDVWGLTPDQCWNVNGSGASQSPKRQWTSAITIIVLRLRLSI